MHVRATPGPPVVQDTIRHNLDRIHARIRAARDRGPAPAAHTDLVVVTKSIDAGLFGPLAAAGVRDVGENRVQSAAERRPLGPKEWTWHGIGHLQRNKARTALATFDLFHALDSERLAGHLDRLLDGTDRRWPVFLQVNAAEDPAKGGFFPDAALDALRAVARLPHLEPRGFMTMARLGASEGDLRATFRTLRQIRDDALGLGLGEAPVTGLSMGMSDDFEVAVEEGSTLVRVGRAVFDGVSKDTAPVSPRPGSEPAVGGETS
jgi:pyridoxal phosphate enzyme (YggS family)